ncbi:hypothetical protein WG66_001454 [Moniliophthora roreri]|nr:hypothetical protein WG66_001454 [Moniliophthora roreri]
MQRRSYLANDEPLDALYKHFNVYNISSTFASGTSVPSSIDVPVRRDAHMPTHLLALYPSDMPSDNSQIPSQPTLVPVDANLYNRGFRSEVIPVPPPGTLSPVPHSKTSSPHAVVTLPVVPLCVPNPSSVPLLLLYGMGLEANQHYLTTRLLPSQVIEEFPNAAEMAQVFAARVRDSSEYAERLDDETIFQRRIRFIQGLWQNILALGLRDVPIAEVVKTAWNVAAEARRLRTRYKSARGRWVD